MEIFKYMETKDYEQLVFCQDKTSGLKAIIAIHDTTLGRLLVEHVCGRMQVKKKQLKMHFVLRAE